MQIPYIASLLALSALVMGSPVLTGATDLDLDSGTWTHVGNQFEQLASCGFPSGNCYDNGCEGQRGKNQDTCTSGEFSSVVSLIAVRMDALGGTSAD